MALLLVGFACGGQAELAGKLGSRFADVYEAGGPLVALHHAYADSLFIGTEVHVPTDLESACEAFARALAVLHLELVVQTESAEMEWLTDLVRLRADVDSFCATYQPMLERIAASEPPVRDVLQEASEARLFASIGEWDMTLEGVLSRALDAMGDGAERWSFAVAFSVRTLLHQETIDRIDEGLGEILFGTDEATGPPVPVPPAVAEAIAALAALCGRSVGATEVQEAICLAECIHRYLVDDIVEPCL